MQSFGFVFCDFYRNPATDGGQETTQSRKRGRPGSNVHPVLALPSSRNFHSSPALLKLKNSNTEFLLLTFTFIHHWPDPALEKY